VAPVPTQTTSKRRKKTKRQNMLATLSRICKASHLAAAPTISSSFLVKFDAHCARTDQLYYLALGHHEFFIVDHDLGTVDEGVGVLAVLYTSVNHVSLDADDFELFRVDLAQPPRVVSARKGDDSVPEAMHVTFRCVERRRVVDEIIVALKTDYMFQTWEVCPDVVERVHKVVWGRRSTAAGARPALMDSFAVTSSHEVRESLQSYFFFRPSEYLPSTRDRRGSHKLQFEVSPDPDKSNPDAASLQVMVVEPTGERAVSVQTLCERSIRDWGASCQEWRVMCKPTTYVKKMNLTGDPAAWTCFEMRVRTFRGVPGARRFEYRDVTAIAARRSFIPPTMLHRRDFVVFHVSARKDFGGNGHLIAERLVDSLSPEAAGFDCDALLVQAAADALLLDEAAYAWMASSLHVVPKSHALAKAYCAALVALLAKVGAVDAVHASAVPPEKERTPGAIADEAERLDDDDDNDDDSVDEAERRAWRMRVRKYFGFCVDGGVFPGVLTIGELARQWRVSPEKKFKADVGAVLEWLLHLRPRGGDFDAQAGFAALATDDAFMRACSFDEAVMARLLESGFIQTSLQGTGDASAYSRFLVRLLRMTGDCEEDAEALRYAVVKRLVEQSANASHDSVDDVVDDVALNYLVPVLVNVLVNYPQDDKLRVLAVATLVNFSHKNRSVKASILAGGTARILVDLLRSPNDDLVRHTCSLLTNLTKAPEFRANVAKGLAIPLLLSMLERKRIAPHFRSSAIVAQAASVLGNLAIDGDLRALILGSGDKAGEDAVPASVRLLVYFFITPAQELCKDLTATQREREVVLTSCAFALKNLAVSSPAHPNNTKRTMARIALRSIVDVLRDGKDGRLIDVVLRLLHVLAFDAKVAQRMVDDAVPALLDKHKTDFPELVLQLHSKLNQVKHDDAGAISESSAAEPTPDTVGRNGGWGANSDGPGAAARANGSVVGGGGGRLGGVLKGVLRTKKSSTAS